ncbi:hypothetical protein LCGC14_0789890 [marine sediment metagenome]|uniref:Uncharacterized protein n=1 Tax=marine sediment metagenome TaxID=412755 RepID=A0A0F9PX74_9ZZZZ
MPKLLYRTTMPHPDDPEIIASITAAVNKGHPLASAAALAGIHDETLYHWTAKGREELAQAEGHTLLWEELGSHARLVIHIKEALAGLVDEALDHVRAGGKDWAAWMTLLERRMPKDFGRNQAEAQALPAPLGFAVLLPPEAVQGLLDIAQRAQNRGARFLPPGGESP